MEHAVEALKLAAAVIVFVLAVSLTYMLFSQTKTTADSIFYIRDSQKYMEEENLENIVYITSTGVTTNRTVNMETIIPTLYRYHKENFGVTIVVKDDAGNYKILARYDNTTENIVGTWDGTEPTIAEGTPEEDKPSITKHLTYLNNYVTIKKDNSEDEEYTWDYPDLSNIYKVERIGEGERVATPWLNSEQGIASRISSDVSGIEAEYNGIDIYSGIQEVNGKTCLLEYSDKQFKEYIKVIDNNKYIKEVGENSEEVLTDFIEERLIAKIEIIYIEE